MRSHWWVDAISEVQVPGGTYPRRLWGKKCWVCGNWMITTYSTQEISTVLENMGIPEDCDEAVVKSVLES